MDRWDAADVVFLTLNHNISMMGKTWLILVVLLRLLLLLLAGFPLYEDERESFVCNTIQPGCSSVCYDTFCPLSPLRFWLLHTAVACLSYALLAVYIVHMTLADLTAGRVGGPHLFRHQSVEAFPQTTPGSITRGDKGLNRRGFTCAYLIHLTARILLEAGFGVGHYFLFGLSVPKSFLCYKVPCTSMVECYVSRPTEKTFTLDFMLATSALCLLVNVADLIYTGRRWRRLRVRARTAASQSSVGEGASVCLEGAGPSSALQNSPGSEAGATHDNNHTQEEEEGGEAEGSRVELCLRDQTGVMHRAHFTHIKPPLAPKPMWDLTGKANGSTLVHSRLEETTSNILSKNSEAPGRRAWV